MLYLDLEVLSAWEGSSEDPTDELCEVLGQL